MKEGKEITSILQITSGGHYHSATAANDFPLSDGTYFDYLATKNGWVINIIALACDGTNRIWAGQLDYNGTAWTLRGWTSYAQKDDLDAIVSTTGVINPNGSEFTVDIAGITASWCPIIQLMDCLQTVTRITCPFTGRLSVTLSGVVNGNIRYVLWYRKK